MITEDHSAIGATAPAVQPCTGEVACPALSPSSCACEALACQSEAEKGRHQLVTGRYPAGSTLGSYRLSNTDSKWGGLKRVLIEVRRHPKLNHYWRLAWNFLEYLSSMEKAKFIVSGFDLNNNTSKKNIGLYVNRWTEIYRKRQLAKLYQLDGWWKENRTPVTMMTLTTYQDGKYSQSIKGKPVTIEESFELLKEGWNKLSKILRKYIKNLNYIWVVEPHTSGYPGSVSKVL